MAFIKYIPIEEQDAANGVPDTDNILQIHAINPKVMRQHYELYLQVMHRASPLSRREREILAVRVSVMNHCLY